MSSVFSGYGHMAILIRYKFLHPLKGVESPVCVVVFLCAGHSAKKLKRQYSLIWFLLRCDFLNTSVLVQRRFWKWVVGRGKWENHLLQVLWSTQALRLSSETCWHAWWPLASGHYISEGMWNAMEFNLPLLKHFIFPVWIFMILLMIFSI